MLRGQGGHGVGHALNIPLTPPNDAARRLAYRKALEQVNTVVPLPKVMDRTAMPELEEAPLARNPAQEAAVCPERSYSHHLSRESSLAWMLLISEALIMESIGRRRWRLGRR